MRSLLYSLVLVLWWAVSAPCAELTVIADSFNIAPNNISVFSTPIATYGDNIFFTQTECPNTGCTKLNLETVVYKGVRSSHGKKYDWQRVVINSSTINDPWHTQSSIAVDKLGYVHVAYGMHHIPWQYSVSEKPDDISGFVFKGQRISSEQLRLRAVLNRTPFGDSGSGCIQGNQITYPMFYYDNNQDIYITYRFAVHPNRKWLDRLYAGGVSRYNANSKAWEALGAGYALQSDSVSDYRKGLEYKVFAAESGYAVYLVNLAFDSTNNLHAAWMWRKKSPGRLTTNPSYVKISSKNINKLFSLNNCMPIEAWDGKEYLPQISLAVDNHDKPYALVQRADGKRRILKNVLGKWDFHSNSPYGATVIKFDKHNNFWAFASGPTVSKWNTVKRKWDNIFVNKEWVNVKVHYDIFKDIFFIYANNKSNDKSSVFIFKDQ